MSKSIGREVINTVYNHPDFEKLELRELAKDLAIASAVSIVVQIRNELDSVPEGYPEEIKQIFLSYFIMNFDNQISKGKGR